MSGDGEKGKEADLPVGYLEKTGFCDVRNYKVGEKKKWLRLGDRALAVMEGPHHSSSPFCHTLLPSSQGLPSGADRGCAGERWLLCHPSPPLLP